MMAHLIYKFTLLFSLSTLVISGERITKFRLVSPEEVDVRLVGKLVDLSDGSPPRTGARRSPYTPILFWHGMGDTAYGSLNIERLALQRLFPNITVLSVQIGNDAMQDRLASYFSNVNSQIEDVCKSVLAHPEIRAHGALNMVGFSQGSQFLRGLIQRCPMRAHNIRVKNYISLGGQHQGVFGLPNCLLKGFCQYINYLLSTGAYEDKVQASLVQAEYWHDPTKEEIYRQKSVFIADINNDRQINQTYIDNLLQLDAMVLVQFEQDRMVIPKESSQFGFYAIGDTSRLVALEQSDLYISDRLGLKRLKESSRLHMISIPGDHLQYNMTWFNDNIALVYLNN